ncbi:MAG: type III pantothenate kinase [Cyanobacteriota bacterium]|nr:type III pantothenate kinase [Cyanobacteriota bacterium]
MSLGSKARWLLVGNSRWHWAEQRGDGVLHGWDGAASAVGDARGGDGPPPLAWAAVGPRPDARFCPPERQVVLADVPLRGCPPWLGVDRALAGWGAWQELGTSVLVVDGGTVLSLTRVDGDGTFRGGRLLAGLRLQLEAMGQGTALIPQILRQHGGEAWSGQSGQPPPEDPAWPQATAAAMQVGVERGLVAAITQAAREAACPWVVFTGGDGGLFHQRGVGELERHGLRVAHRPLLCLESLARLRPPP